MLKQENLAANFCGLLSQQGIKGLCFQVYQNICKFLHIDPFATTNKYTPSCKPGTAIEWRILGQEQDGSLLAAWVSLPYRRNETDDDRDDAVLPPFSVGRTNIGLYIAAQKSFNVLHTFADRQNVVQASVNASHTLLAFVVKDTAASAALVYIPFLVEVNNAAPKEPYRLLEMSRSKQVMVQFLWRKQSTFEKLYQDKFLLFIHKECKQTDLTR